MLVASKRSIKKFFGVPGIKSALSTLILIAPLVLGLWNGLHFEIKIGLIVATAILNLGLVYYEYTKPKWRIEDMLNMMNLSLWAERNQHFRANIMMYNHRKKTLSVKYISTSMMGATDRKLCIGSNQGCAGEAFRSKRLAVVDLTQQTHEDYQINPQDVWSEMKSVMSVPIFDDDAHMNVIAVLNVDSDFTVNDANFYDNTVIRVISAYSDWIADLL